MLPESSVAVDGVEGDLGMASILETTEQSWQGDVLDAQGAVLVDFWAEWCGPCRMMEPLLAQLVEKLGDRLTIAKLNVQEYPDLAASCGVMNLPTLVLYKQGQAVEQLNGYMPLRVLEDKVAKHL
jgi:thioredoxin 1